MSRLLIAKRRAIFTPGIVGEGGTQTKSFVSDNTTDFLNPERGWYVEDGGGLGAVHPNPTPVWDAIHYTTLNLHFVRLDSYKATPSLPSGFLTSLSSTMDGWRSSGKKAVLRVAYDRVGAVEDAPWSVMTNHITQLAPIINSHKDVIATVQAGLVGAWGEMGVSPNGHTPTSVTGKAFIRQMLDDLDSDILVSVRTPQWMVGIFDNDTTLPTFADRFTGSDKSRLASFNDCIGAGYQMVTWWGDAPWAGNWHAEREYQYTAGRLSVSGGESCDNNGLGAFNDGPYMITQFEGMGIDYLNSEYWPTLYNKWKTSGHLFEISRRLGYRLSLLQATLPTTLTRGQPFNLSLTMHNQGFGKVYNPRPLDVILTPIGGGSPVTVRMSNDIRRDFPLGGETTSPTFTVTLPGSVPTGTYAVSLALPDRSSYLESDPRYSIRLANEDMWVPLDGRNDLDMTVSVA